MSEVPENELTTRRERAFAIAKRGARQVLRRRFHVLRLARDSYGKLGENENALERVASDLRTMMRLAVAWARREYQQIPWRSLLYLVAALVYFLNPVDLIPDALVGIGFIDDVAVVGAVVSSIHKDLVNFRQWEESDDVDREQAVIEE